MKRLTMFLFLIGTILIASPAAHASGGWYQGGIGSSHKGGKYRNPETGDHYRHRY